MTQRVPHTPLQVAFKHPWPGTRRGFCLWLLGIAMIALGLTRYVLAQVPPPDREALSFALRLSHGSAPFWGWAMAAVGAFAIGCSYCHFGRDRYGYTAVCVFTAAWGLGYLTGLLYGAPPRSVGACIIWLLFSALFAAVAGFPNVRLGRHPPILAPDAAPPAGG